MEMATDTNTDSGSSNRRRNRFAVGLTYAALSVGSLSSSLLSRFYFVHGGSSRWVSTWLQSAGFPLLLIPILANSRHRRGRGAFSQLNIRLLAISLLIGLFLGLNNFFFAWGVSYLPVSTSSLLLSSQLAFNLLLSAVIVNQKLRFTNVNCVALLTMSSVLLAFNAGGDRPPGVTATQFFVGFLATLACAAMFAVYLPIMELVYRGGARTYGLVVEMQFVTEAAATAFATVGMAADGGWFEERKRGFDLGMRKYYWVIVIATAASWQLVFMGTAGMVFLTTSLNGGIFSTALLSLNVLGGVLVFGDAFGGVKGVALGLCLWGFASYLYGEHITNKKIKKIGGEGNEMELISGNNGEVAA